MLLVAAIVFILALAGVACQAQVTADTGAQTSSAQKELLQLETFVDRLVVKNGEGINVKVWVESKLMESATVTLHFTEDQLVLEGASSRPLSKDFPMSFTFTGKRNGKSSILVRVDGTHKDTKERITASQRLEGIEVQAKTQWWAPLYSTDLSV